MTTVLKLGGSLITEKTEEEVLDREQLERVCSTIANASALELVLVHGGGSFGHSAAAQHGIDTAQGTRNAGAIHDVMNAMDRLRELVVDALLEADVPAIGLPPRALAVKGEDGDLELAPLAVAAALAEGLVPVLHGDVVLHTGRGATVLSGDTLAVAIAGALDADRVGFCTGVDGVLDSEGSIVPQVRDFDDVDDLLGETRGTDVSGGMGTKVGALLAGEVPGAIFGLDGLEAFLDGALPGTRVRPADTDPF